MEPLIDQIIRKNDDVNLRKNNHSEQVQKQTINKISLQKKQLDT